jgi:pimeloyl-ACP methyl ester carboxylesterase
MKKYLAFIFILLPLFAHAQYTDYWTGKLSFGIEVTIEFNVTFGDDFTPRDITLDCPEQNAWELKCDLIKWTKDSFNIDIPIAGVKYYGKKEHHDSIATGNWIQAGIPLPLTLTRSLTGINPVRPQNPPLEHDYLEETLLITNPKDNVQLFATLTIPKGFTMKGCAVMITGSGQQDMDESMMGHKPFWVIADYLTRNGFAVIRFDDRGSYRSSGNFSTSSVFDFATDVNAVINMAKERTGLPDNKIGLIGHSEGSMVAQIVLKDRPLGFYISLAGPAAPVQQLMYQQNKDLIGLFNISETEFNKTVGPFLHKVLAIAGDLSIDSATAATKIIKLYKKTEKKFSDSAKKRFALGTPESAGGWLGKPLRIFLSYIPENNLAIIKTPFLAINGTKDKQVNSEVNLAIFKKYLKNNPLNEVKEVENKNHLFQTTTKGDISEYGKLEETFAPEVLEMMKAWLNKVFP